MKQKSGRKTAAPQLRTLSQVWPKLSDTLSVIKTQRDYKRIVALLDVITDAVGNDEDHPLASLMELLGVLVEDYEQAELDEINATPIETLRFLMAEHGLVQKDLPELGSQGVVSEILRGKRRLNVRQIRALSKRFRVDPAVFVG